MTQGHQLRFFTHSDDLPELADGLVALGALAAKARSSEPRPSVSIVRDLQPGSTTLLTTQDLTDHLEPRLMPSGIWVLTAMRDPVVELSTSPFDGNVIEQGRLYYTADYSTGDRMVRKPEALTTFAGAVESWLRGWLVRKDRRMLGPAAASGLDAGLIEVRD
jgi:hypothetical protein